MTMLAENLADLFERHLEFAYDAERHLEKELPKFIDAASSAHLRTAFEQSLEQCKIQADRLDQIFASLDRPSATEADHAFRDILSEGEKLINHIDRSPLLDSALIIVMNQARHHEIASYGALVSLARLRGLEEAAGLLSQTLAEEKAADSELTSLAVDTVNADAIGFQNTPRGIIII
jgi:ferritin-like metal-binding protein YciE